MHFFLDEVFSSVGSVTKLFKQDTEVDEAEFEKVNGDPYQRVKWRILNQQINLTSELNPPRPKTFEIFRPDDYLDTVLPSLDQT